MITSYTDHNRLIVLFPIICGYFVSISDISNDSLHPTALHSLLSVSSVMFSVLLLSRLLMLCLLSPVALHISFCLISLSNIMCLIASVTSSILLYSIIIYTLPPKV
uniref:Uncharacterized protein n=1 Tax=Siphoviridae sp. ctqPo10 TaxID=2827948 RepID=A0A8S5SUC8_9CAUD|nr:MAG TPA: hypothetical protein [Siphoviridae sp. ctqPo10]